MSMVYCRGCGQQIHDSALTCPHCGAPQKTAGAGNKYSSYQQVPWYRKNWFAILSFLFFFPVTVGLLATGDVYYQRNGELKTYSTGVKVFFFVLCALWLVAVISSAAGS